MITEETIVLAVSSAMPVINMIAIWDVVWKGIGMWTAARNDSKPWFIAILILNTAGILPIIYLLMERNKKMPKKDPVSQPSQIEDEE